MVETGTLAAQGCIKIIPVSTTTVIGKSEPTDSHVLWAETFKDSERQLLRQHLQDESAGCTYQDMFYMWGRAVWQPHMKSPSTRKRWMDSEYGRVAVFLHPLSGHMTTSWAFMKFAKQFLDMGMSVVFIDFPGFGRSSVATKVHVEVERWIDYDWRIVSDMLVDMGVQATCTVSCEESCGTVLRMLLCLPQMLGAHHIFLNPVFSLDSIFSGQLAPSRLAGTDEQARLKRARPKEVLVAMQKNGFRVWVNLDREQDAKTAEAREQLHWWSSQKSGGGLIKVLEVTRMHISQVTAGAKVPIGILYPCKLLKRLWAQWISGRLPDPPLALPDNPSEFDGTTTLASTFRSQVSTVNGSMAGTFQDASSMRLQDASSMASSPSSGGFARRKARSAMMSSTMSAFNQSASLPDLSASRPLTGMSRSSMESGMSRGGGVGIVLATKLAKTRRHDGTESRKRILSIAKAPQDANLDSMIDKSSLEGVQPGPELEDLSLALERSVHDLALQEQAARKSRMRQATLESQMDGVQSGAKLPPMLIRRLAKVKEAALG
mmetsp:Transcript_64744/g.189855  ORF Transcript_64744/g.189855 Transcript_64744/m.189855 type:complete len:547 (+) Transcript_64744:134-1774(+)